MFGPGKPVVTTVNQEKPLWQRVLFACFSEWAFLPAFALLLVGVVPEHTLYHAVSSMPFVKNFPMDVLGLIGLIDQACSPTFAVAASMLRPDIAAWLKSAPQDVIVITYLGSMLWGTLSVAVLLSSNVSFKSPVEMDRKCWVS
ncbi:hypothetical protein [Chromobacterium haemolyticum]|uniref:hypothetical protein n=1 Tax=Chromobacterium haemolyticum TaxID=394935 RepID=UPI00244D77B1|nr:hypothetical protein [Chromobacterium haemolyticum]MDH0342029.1 hypothetical protein [Chromobacterium haemolyticum]